MMRKVVASLVLVLLLGWSAVVVGQEDPVDPSEPSEPANTEETTSDEGAQVEDQARRMAEDLASEQEQERRDRERRLTVMINGSLDGNFARVNCRLDEGHGELYWAKQAGYFHLLDEMAGAGGLSRPIGLNVGDSIFPGALSRYLLSQESGGQRLAELVAQIPVEAHGLGNRELDTSREALVDFAEALQGYGIDLQASNLACESFDGAEAICTAVNRGQEDHQFSVVERDGVRLAVTTVLSEDLLEPLAQGQREGLRVLNPMETLPELVAAMREEADLVIVQYNLRQGHALERAFELAGAVEGIDLMITNHLLDTSAEPDREGLMSVVQAEQTGTPIISGASTEGSVINAELSITRRDDEGWALRSVTPRRTLINEMPDHPATEELLKESISSFCADWGDPLGEYAELAEPFEMEDLRTFILNVMRFSTNSEVALSNRGAFRDESQFPLTGQLTSADIYTSLPYANALVTAQIEGSTLKKIAAQLGVGLVATGLRVDGDKVLVNGRPIAEGRLYQVALNDYLIGGEDGVLTEEDLVGQRVHHPRWSPEPPSIDELVVQYVRSGDHVQRGQTQNGVSATGNFPDLYRRFLWTFTGSLNASYNQVNVGNPDPGYEQSQFTVQSTDQINIDGRLTSEADSRNHRWNNDLNLQYATARLAEEGAGFEETKDLIRLRSRYRYQRLRAGQNGGWYIPDPLVEGQLESEFSSPETRDWHRMDLRAILGMSFQLFNPLDFRLGVNMSQDVSQPDSEATFGVNAGYTLARIDLINLLGRPIQFESEVEYFYNDIGQDNIHEIRNSNRVFFAVFDQFFFTTTFNIFAFRNDPIGEFGTNRELTVGLNYQWDAVAQRF